MPSVLWQVSRVFHVSYPPYAMLGLHAPLLSVIEQSLIIGLGICDLQSGGTLQHSMPASLGRHSCICILYREVPPMQSAAGIFWFANIWD